MGVKQPKNRASSFFGLIFVFLIFILAVSLISFFHYSVQPRLNNQDEGVSFWLEGDPTQITGQEKTFSIFIKNREARDLKNVQAVLKFSQGFVLTFSEPQCNQVLADQCTWLFSDVKKGELKEIELKGRIFGQADKVQFFNGYLSFQLQDFSSEFQKNLSSSVALESPIFITWNMPEKGSFFDEIKSVIYLENITSEIIPQTEVVIDCPEDFSLAQGGDEIIADEDKHTVKWRINDLGPFKKKKLEFSGYLENSSLQEAIFKLRAGLINNGDSFLQITQEKKISVTELDFNVSLQVNPLHPLSGVEEKQSDDFVGGYQVCNWGEVLPVDLIYSNNSRETVKDLTLELALSDNQYIDFNRLSQSLLWLSEEVSPGDKGKISFSLPIKSGLEAVKGHYSQAEMTIQILAKGKFVGKEREWEIKGEQIKVKIGTNLGLKAAARYYNDERLAIGQGPLPPRIGEETRYWIFWQVKNTTNPVESIFIKTQLPEWVNWVGRTEASYGTVSYDGDNHQVFWQISDLSIYQGGPYSLVEAGFEISIRPTLAQFDLFLPLTQEIYLTARDQFTDGQISLQVSSLTTELIDDPIGQGLGRVTE